MNEIRLIIAGLRLIRGHTIRLYVAMLAVVLILLLFWGIGWATDTLVYVTAVMILLIPLITLSPDLLFGFVIFGASIAGPSGGISIEEGVRKSLGVLFGGIVNNLILTLAAVAFLREAWPGIGTHLNFGGFLVLLMGGVATFIVVNKINPSGRRALWISLIVLATMLVRYVVVSVITVPDFESGLSGTFLEDVTYATLAKGWLNLAILAAIGVLIGPVWLEKLWRIVITPLRWMFTTGWKKATFFTLILLGIVVWLWPSAPQIVSREARKTIQQAQKGPTPVELQFTLDSALLRAIEGGTLTPTCTDKKGKSIPAGEYRVNVLKVPFEIIYKKKVIVKNTVDGDAVPAQYAATAPHPGGYTFWTVIVNTSVDEETVTVPDSGSGTGCVTLTLNVDPADISGIDIKKPTKIGIQLIPE